MRRIFLQVPIFFTLHPHNWYHYPTNTLSNHSVQSVRNRLFLLCGAALSLGERMIHGHTGLFQCTQHLRYGER